MNAFILLLSLTGVTEFQLICLDVGTTQDTLEQVIALRNELDKQRIKCVFELFPNFFVVTKSNRLSELASNNPHIHIEESSQWHNWESNFPEAGKYMKPIWLNVFSPQEPKYAKTFQGTDRYIIDTYVPELTTVIDQEVYTSQFAPYGAKGYDTNSYLTGRVAINIWALEQDFSEQQLILCMERSVFGLRYILDTAPEGANLTFVIGVPEWKLSNYNPNLYDAYVHVLLMKELYSQILPPNELYFMAYENNNLIRDKFGCPWALQALVFAGRFTNASGLAPFCGGPYFIGGFSEVAYMPIVFAHELLHCFGALDEDKNVGDPGDIGGYFGIANGNSEKSNPFPENCIMRYQRQTELCTYTRLHIGWKDLDYDGILDVDSHSPVINIAQIAALIPKLKADISGNVVAERNRSPQYSRGNPKYTANNITLKTLSSLLWKLNATDPYQEFTLAHNNGSINASITLPVTVPKGTSNIYLRLKDSRGLVSDEKIISILKDIETETAFPIKYNMSSGKLVSSLSNPIDVKIYNLSGALIMNRTLTAQGQLMLSELSPGLYYVSIPAAKKQLKIAVLP